MKDAGYVFLVLLSSLLMLTGCSRRDILDEYPVSGVNIKFDWNGVTDKLPEGMRVIFYPTNAEGKKVDRYVSVKGGEVKVPPGHYSVVAYNYNTEIVQIRGEGAYETIEAFTGHCNGLGIAGTENLLWGPDPLYVVQIDDLYIKNSEEELLLDWKPKLVVKTYSLKIKAEGLGYVSSIVGSVEGLAGRYYLGLRSGKISDAPIYFEAKATPGEITGEFTAFVMPEAAVTRAGTSIKLMLTFIKVDQSAQEVEIDITDVVEDAEKGEEGDDDEPPKVIELLLEEEVKVEEPSNPPGGGGGGIGGEVGGWGNEEEVVLPVN